MITPTLPTLHQCQLSALKCLDLSEELCTERELPRKGFLSDLSKFLNDPEIVIKKIRELREHVESGMEAEKKCRKSLIQAGYPSDVVKLEITDGDLEYDNELERRVNEAIRTYSGHIAAITWGRLILLEFESLLDPYIFREKRIDDEPYLFEPHYDSWFKSYRSEAGCLPRLKNRSEIESRIIRESLQAIAAEETSERQRKQEVEQGVSIYDVTFAGIRDEATARDAVRRFSDSKKLKTSPLGQCPHDGRAKLYRLDSLLSDYKKFTGINQSEITRIFREIYSKLRSPTK